MHLFLLVSILLIDGKFILYNKWPSKIDNDQGASLLSLRLYSRYFITNIDRSYEVPAKTILKISNRLNGRDILKKWKFLRGSKTLEAAFECFRLTILE